MAALHDPKGLSAAQASRLRETMELIKRGDVDAALTMARRLEADAPKAPDARQLLAMCLAEAGDAKAAQDAFEAALMLSGSHHLVLHNYATFLRRQDRLADAMNALRQAVSRSPSFVAGWAELGICALQADLPVLAIEAFSRALQLEPAGARHWQGLGSAYRAAGEFEVAESAMRRLLQLTPDFAPGWLNLGVVQRLLGRLEQALESFERAEQLGCSGPELLDARAGVLLDRGEPAAALAQALEVTHRHPDFVGGHQTLAHVLWEYGATVAPAEDPAARLRIAAAAQPDNRALRTALARFLLAAGDSDEALDQVRALRASADSLELALLEASALEALDRIEQAATLFERVHAQGGSANVQFLNAHARHLLKSGSWDRAALCAEAATVLQPQNQESWAYLATAWRLLEDPRELWLCDYERLIGWLPVDPPEGFAGMHAFLQALEHSLDRVHNASHAPLQQSLRGGSQTPGSLFGRSDPVLQAAQATLMASVCAFQRSLPNDPKHPFLSAQGQTMRMVGAWSVRLWSGGRHVNHVHPQGWLSSAFYVSLPPSMGAVGAGVDDAGCIQFGQPPVELGLELAPRLVLRPQAGRLALFPSYIWHGTVPFVDRRPRLAIAFDARPALAAGRPSLRVNNRVFQA